MNYCINLITLVILACGITRSYGMESLTKEAFQPLENITPQQLSSDKPVAFRLERSESSSGWRLHAHTIQGDLIADFFAADPRSDNAHSATPVCHQAVSAARAFYLYARNAASKEIVDLWPVNGRCTQPMSELFSKAVLRELRAQAAVADSIGGEQLRLFVLDVKDKIGRYRSGEQIARAEVAMRDALVDVKKGHVENHIKKGRSICGETQMRFLQPLRTSRLSFFLREGLLKAMLVAQVFTAAQILLFDSPGEDNGPGRAAFCMLCELLMNGFKMGYAVRLCSDTKSHIFHPDEFFEYASPPEQAVVVATSHESLALCIKQLHSVRLHTFYSPYYKEMYGPDQHYYVALTNFFKTAHRLHMPRIEKKGDADESENMITHISLEDNANRTGH